MFKIIGFIELESQEFKLGLKDFDFVLQEFGLVVDKIHIVVKNLQVHRQEQHWQLVNLEFFFPFQCSEKRRFEFQQLGFHIVDFWRSMYLFHFPKPKLGLEYRKEQTKLRL